MASVGDVLPLGDLIIKVTEKTLLVIKDLIKEHGDAEDVKNFSVVENGVNLVVKLYKENVEQGSSYWKMGFLGIKTIIPAIPVIANTLFNGKNQSQEETECHAIVTLETFQGINDDKLEFEDAFTKWDEGRKRLIELLQTVVEEMKTRKKRTGIAKLTGVATSIVGTTVSIGAIGLSFVTAGLCTPIAVATVAGVAVATTGGIVAGGASITDEILKGKSN
ncbi:uncharacterized protein [Antedon mediterranea]|uniref:uncharacterized protein n=1 Tax=Antedon mediterranea TaxID=105859 RepID=UPI003AF64FE4